jgi:TPR repeat protein
MRTMMLARCVLFLVTLGLVTAFTVSAQANTFFDGWIAAVNDDYPTALRIWRPLAKQGNASAQNGLGTMHLRGLGVPQDYAEAAKWYRKAAEQGHEKAQYSLGRIYRHGKGVPHDYTEAVKWFRKAAEQGDADAQYTLGEMYLFADEVSKEDGSFPDRVFMFMAPKGTTENSVKALPWFIKAAEQGATGAQVWLGGMYSMGRGVPQDHAEAFKWRLRAAKQGDADAQYFLGGMYSSGEGTPEDHSKALKWYRLAAEQGHDSARLFIGYIFKDGSGVLQDFVQAHMWFNLAGAKGKSERDELAARMTPGQIAEAQRLAREWRPSKSVRDAQALVVAPPPSSPRKATVSTGIDFGRYHALVIGNNKYRSLPNLKTAVSDADATADLLKDHYGFTVTLLTNATRADILGTLAKLRGQLTDRDNLLIYYAGHGWLDEAAGRGYWWPVDAHEDDPTNWIDNANITGAVRAMSAKHILVVADSCYSGSLTRGIKVTVRTDDSLHRMSRKKARTVLTSGGLEPVADSGGGNHSAFAKAFLDVLRENKGVLDGHRLFTLMRRPVMVSSDQTPEYGDIRKAGHDGGDFLFVRTQ